MGFGDWVKDRASDVGGFVEDKVDDAGEWLEGAYEDGKETVGGWVDDGSSALADVLDHVGLEGAADFVEDTGDDIADALGDEVSERELGDSDDPQQLVHGEVEKINEVATHLSSFAGSMASASSGLAGIDAGGWTGSAADGFDTKMSAQPMKWSTAGDACGDAAKAWTSYASTVTWAQGQATSAIQQYDQGKEASESAVKAHNDKVDTWNQAVNAGTPADQMPAEPGAFTDPGKADMEAAQHTLDQARKQRDEAAERAASTIRSATAGAPQEPDFTDRMGANASDLLQMKDIWSAHVTGGVLKGTGSLVKFVRGLNPTDPYNMRHPAAYLEGLSNTTTGLIHTANHPVEAVSAIIGSGWTTDPAEAFGELLPNLIGTVGTGGAGAAATITSRTAVRTLEEILQRGGTRGLEDAAERGAMRSADDLASRGARGLDDLPAGTHGPNSFGDPADLSRALERNGWDPGRPDRHHQRSPGRLVARRGRRPQPGPRRRAAARPGHRHAEGDHPRAALAVPRRGHRQHPPLRPGAGARFDHQGRRHRSPRHSRRPARRPASGLPRHGLPHRGRLLHGHPLQHTGRVRDPSHDRDGRLRALRRLGPLVHRQRLHQVPRRRHPRVAARTQRGGHPRGDHGRRRRDVVGRQERRAAPRRRLQGRRVGEGPMSSRLESSANYATYRGRDLCVAFQGRDEVALDDDGGEFPDALERGRSARAGAWVKVPGPSLDRMYRRGVSATWRGEKVFIDRVDDATGAAGFWFTGEREWALAHGLEGSQHDGGYSGVAPVGEFTDVVVTEADRSIPGADR